MRSRNIKPGFYKNEQLAECSFEARLLFPGLWMLADRAGRMEYRPKRIKAELFPFDNLDVVKLVSELEREKLVVRYQSGNIQYLWMPGFTKHQAPHIKEKQSELPECPLERTMLAPCEHQESTMPEPCEHPLIPDSLLLIPDSLIPKEKDSCAEPLKTEVQALESTEPPIIIFPLSRKGTEQAFYQSDIDQWRESFPGVDLEKELLKCRQWNLDNPTKRKTRAGIRKHISAWLGRAQDSAKPSRGGQGGNGKIRAYSVKDAATIQHEEIARALNDEHRKQQQHLEPGNRQEGGILLEHQIQGGGVC